MILTPPRPEDAVQKPVVTTRKDPEARARLLALIAKGAERAGQIKDQQPAKAF